MLLGIDEAGRGPWAGPLVVGAVVLGGIQIDGLTDSKKLSKKKREQLFDVIQEQALGVSTGWVSAAELDDIGMSQALRLATRRAVEQIKTPFHEIIIDGTVNFLSETALGPHVTTMPKADLLIPCVSAASIVAKVSRDRFMASQDEKYPGYGFGKHAGYGVASHRAAIAELGVTPLHRLSFAPLRQYAPKVDATQEQPKDPVIATTKQVGTMSESAACKYLESNGHTIIARNWKNKYCEIDIVSQLGAKIYFTEVKHRKNDKAGDGISAITTKKLNQMKFAAKFYAAANKITDKIDLQLAAISTSGDPPEVLTYLEIK